MGSIHMETDEDLESSNTSKMVSELWQPVWAVDWLSLMVCGKEPSLEATEGSHLGLCRPDSLASLQLLSLFPWVPPLEFRRAFGKTQMVSAESGRVRNGSESHT